MLTPTFHWDSSIKGVHDTGPQLPHLYQLIKICDKVPLPSSLPFPKPVVKIHIFQTIPNAPVHKYTQTEKSTLIWAVAVGSIVGTFPFNYFYTQHGGRFVFLIAGLISIVSTALVPLAASLGLWVFSAVRFFQVRLSINFKLKKDKIFRVQHFQPILRVLVWSFQDGHH